MNQNYSLVSGNFYLDIHDKISALRKQVWPDFIRLSDETIFTLYERCPDFQIGLVNKETNDLAAIANSIPFSWHRPISELSDEGVSWIIDKGLHEPVDLNSANMMCAVSMSISRDERNKGISKILLEHLKQIAVSKKFTHFVAPVRPTLKTYYPLIPIENYVKWKNKEGGLFDPWLRTHVALGAQILKICTRSARVVAPISQWETWTGMIFPGDGSYIIKDALAPVEIQYKDGIGTYIEPNIWVYYSL